MATGLYLHTAPARQLILGARPHSLAGREEAQLCRREDSSAFPSYVCKKSPCPAFSHQYFPFICLHNRPFSALKPSEKLQRGQAAWQLGGEGGRAQPAPPTNKLLHELGRGKWGGNPAFVSGAGAAGAAAASQILRHPRKRLAEAPQGGGERCQPLRSRRPLGLPFLPPSDGRNINCVQTSGLTRFCFTLMMILQRKGSGEQALEY